MSQCANCSTSSSCNTCKAGFLLYGTNCYIDCSVLNTATQKYSKDPSGKQCVPCPGSCSSCLATSTTEATCYYCESPLFLYQGSCVSDCPTGFFSVTSTAGTRTCQTCSSNCQTCITTPNNCVSCKSDSVDFYLLNNKCISTCPAGFLKNIQTQRCEACPPYCHTCSTQNTCVECILPHLVG